MAAPGRTGISASVLDCMAVKHVTLQILRKDFLAEQRQWEDNLARSAPSDPVAPEDDDGKESSLTSNIEGSQFSPISRLYLLIDTRIVEMVDKILLQEDQELQALIALTERQDIDNDKIVSKYGSDDDEYDLFFSEILVAADLRGKNAGGNPAVPSSTDQEMDTT